MNGPADDDDRLLAELRAAVQQTGGVPAAVSEAARGAFAWRTIDAELAALSYDSLLDDGLLAGVRSGSATTRMLTFDAAELTVEVSVEGGRLVGQLVPPQTGQVEVRHAGGSTTVDADQLGRFSAGEVPPGPFSLRCTTSAAIPVVTDWIVL